jgi:rhamnose utilization protein RhaD (predicted bifunctional aldolase and dehydrogenase)/NAD(P)-dependent dehydrogenase (short-subunit alcohol dehydrogenase family)
MSSTDQQHLNDLIEISRFYGNNKEAVIAGGGNTSYKNDKHIWVKASGTSLATITEQGFVKLSREKLQVIAQKSYSGNPDERELQVKEDLYAACVSTERTLRPSVETSLHEILDYPFVVHLHPTLVNALLCGQDSESITRELFGEEALYIPYTDPGYILFKKIATAVTAYRTRYQKDPQLLFLENHGIFFSADTTDETEALYNLVINKITAHIGSLTRWESLPIGIEIVQIIPALRMMLSDDDLKVARVRNNSLVAKYYDSEKSFAMIGKPFTPDIIVYCKANYLYLDTTGTPEEILQTAQEQIESFKSKNGYSPKIILIKNIGLVAVEDNAASAETALDIFEDLMKISYYTNAFGGPRYMTDQQIQFIENWELENYRRKVAKGSVQLGKVAGKTAIVTGGAMGFGAGIVEDLFREGANVIIADINIAEGTAMQDRLNAGNRKNQAWFVQTDVSSDSSVEELIRKAVELFGGTDIMVSNAGVLQAGGLDEIDLPAFERMTRINYSGYFLCTKYASAVMKLQHQYNNNHFSDIIQINSKSGLKGSNRNFAYAGGKFGGIGLTQSFALELIPYNIKVNAICPGNFFDGPLWADPEKGLFVQYLKAGKVPGATTVEEVRRFYEDQVPARRGCRVEDVMKAMYYIIDQQYETGQAVPVTGGQSMLH